MTKRQQLFTFVLTLSICSLLVTAAAIGIDMARQANTMQVVLAQQQAQVVVEPAAVNDPYAWATPEATPTPLPPPTDTPTPVPTWTPELPTETPTPIPTDTPVPTDTPLPTFTRPPAPTATPAPPTATPTPSLPFGGTVKSFPTGTERMTRVTGIVWKVIDANTGQYQGDAGFQMRMIDPAGQEHLSDVSGIGHTDSTCPDCGDNQWMNMKIEFDPYVPGPYKVDLIRDGQPMSVPVEFTLNAAPQDYVHVDFVPFNF